MASPVSHADESDRTDLDASAEFSDVEDGGGGGQDGLEVPRNLHSAPAMRRAPGASPMRFSFPDESFENSPGVAQRPVHTTVRIRNAEPVVAGGIHAEQYMLYDIEVHAPMGDWSGTVPPPPPPFTPPIILPSPATPPPLPPQSSGGSTTSCP